MVHNTNSRPGTLYNGFGLHIPIDIWYGGLIGRDFLRWPTGQLNKDLFQFKSGFRRIYIWYWDIRLYRFEAQDISFVVWQYLFIRRYNII